MDTFPSSPPAAVRAELAALRTALDQSGIPPKSLDRNVLVATWNIRGFGKVLDKWDSAAADSPRRNLRDVLCLAEVVARFDVVALQEVKRDLGGLRRLMEALGPNWAWILTDFTRGPAGNQERMAFVFDLRRRPTLGPCGRAG
ncbi:MAG TPA: endonuclease/exonuclease/phosphatase family protein [Propionibacteriaceae bacterium]|nr:endonuclease/exonuclease/phosphatase family protein [Propionibacteriaceae bacterium]